MVERNYLKEWKEMMCKEIYRRSIGLPYCRTVDGLMDGGGVNDCSNCRYGRNEI